MNLYKNNVKLPVVKAKRPSFKAVRGRTWDHGSIFIDGVKYEAWLDTTWGFYLYFQTKEKQEWYKIKMFSTLEMDHEGQRYDIDPFDNTTNQLTTVIMPFKQGDHVVIQPNVQKERLRIMAGNNKQLMYDLSSLIFKPVKFKIYDLSHGTDRLCRVEGAAIIHEGHEVKVHELLIPESTLKLA